MFKFLRRRMLRDETGATAVEFALIAPMFFGFVLGIIDVSAYFFTAGQLQHATIQSSRQLRIGASGVVGTGDTPRDAYVAIFCNEIPAGLINDCTNDIRIDVDSWEDFDDIPNPPPVAADFDVDGNGTISRDEMVYESGGPGCAVVVRSFYEYNTLFPGLQYLLGAVVPGTFYIATSTVFRNEPFAGSTFPACAGGGGGSP